LNSLACFDKVGGDKFHGGGESGAEKWVETLKQRPANKPFFMWFAAHDAHRNWDNAIFLPPYKPDEVDVKEWYVDNLPSREDIACYYNEITRFDFYVGQVVAELKKQGVFENTMIIIMADNGRPFPRAKTRLITDGIKTPFIISFPQGIARKGVVSESLISAIDIAPTLVDISGNRPASTFQGKSFKRLLSDSAHKHRNYAFAEHNWHDYEAYGRMVCNDSMLLIINKRPNLTAEGAIDVMGGGVGQSLKMADKAQLSDIQRDIFSTNRDTIELYNYKTDIYQKDNIYKTNQEVAKHLLQILKKWQNETADSEPINITPDWYNRKTLLPTLEWSKRAEMPGAAKKANRTKNKGPF